MVRLGNVWDSTVEVLSGRGAMLAGIAALLIVLPGVVSNILSTMMRTGMASRGLALAVMLVALLSVVFTIWGQLAITAAASDPGILRRDAFALGLRRLPVALGVYLIIIAVAILLMFPIGIAIGVSGVNLAQPGSMIAQGLPAGTRGFVVLYVLALVVFAFWITARLFLLNPVLVNERDGVASLGRSFALTRGLVWRVLGFVLLAGIVLLVGMLAAQLVAGLIFRLLLGADNLALAAILTGVVTQTVTAIYVVVIATFAARLYVAVTGATDRAEMIEPVA